MRIYVVKPVYDAQGNNLFKHIFARKTSDLWSKTGDGEVVEVEWGDGDESLPLGDFIPTTASVFCGQADLVRTIRDRFAPCSVLQSLKVDGGVGRLLMLRPERCMPGALPNDHLFREIDGRSGLLATQDFADFWSAGGFSGASFEDAGELPESRVK